MTPKLSPFAAVLMSHVLLLIFGRVSSTPAENKSSGASNIPLALHYMGEVDGKSYFKDSDISVNWTAGSDYCERANLKLATVQTRAQTDFLKKTLNESLDYEGYWIAGRESRLPSMMVWNGTDEQFDESLSDVWDFGREILYCAWLDLLSARDFRLRIGGLRCSASLPVLCET